MNCPKCGYKRQRRDDAFVPATECPSCGLVYSKHDVTTMPGLTVSTVGEPPQIRKSAVDPESLKKARDRVEKRLRNRIEPRPYEDEHHARTLELARKITRKKARRAEERVVDVKNEAVDDIMNKDQNDKSEKIENQADEALLLNDVVGVQLHDSAQDSSAKALGPEPETDPTASDDMQFDTPTDTEPDGQDVPSVEPPATHAEFNDSDAPDDVQTETVVLESTEQFSIGATEETPEYEGFGAGSEPMDPEVTDPPPAYIAAASQGDGRIRFGAALRRMLPIVAWLILFAGIVGAVLSWTTINNVEAGVSPPATHSPNTLPIGLLLGFAYLATGALGFAFFWASSLINRQLKDIQHQLTTHPITQIRQETAADLPDE
ncbi:MAG: hypothetical protein PVI54_05785 [Desulfobacteraceae bacterium]